MYNRLHDIGTVLSNRICADTAYPGRFVLPATPYTLQFVALGLGAAAVAVCDYLTGRQTGVRINC